MANLEPPRSAETEWNPVRAYHTTQAWQRLLGLGDPVSYGKGLELFAQGSNSDKILLIAVGVVKVSCTLPNGDHVSPGLRYPGQFVEEYAPLTDRPHIVSASAVTNCTIQRIAAERMRELLQTNLAANRLLLPLLLNDLHRQTVATVECDALTAPYRCARLLRELAKVLGALRSEVWVPLPLTEGELGELLGITETHVGPPHDRTFHLRSSAPRGSPLDVANKELI